MFYFHYLFYFLRFTESFFISKQSLFLRSTQNGTGSVSEMKPVT